MKLIVGLLMVFCVSTCIAEDEVILPLQPVTIETGTFTPSNREKFILTETFLLLFIESIREMVIEECIEELAIGEEADWDTYHRKAVNRLRKLKLKPLKFADIVDHP